MVRSYVVAFLFTVVFASRSAIRVTYNNPKGHEAVVGRLVEAGADLNQANKDGDITFAGDPDGCAFAELSGSRLREGIPRREAP